MIPCSHGDTIDYFCRNPLNGYSTDPIETGDIVRGWVYGPIHQGYWMDPGRTAVCGGKPTAAQKRLIEACAGIIERVAAAIKPGANVMELAKLGERLTADAGGGKDQAAKKWPLYGHGVGLFWELPIFGTSMCQEDDILEKDMVIGVETFLAEDGVGSAGFESNYIIDEGGLELITKTPMIWWD